MISTLTRRSRVVDIVYMHSKLCLSRSQNDGYVSLSSMFTARTGHASATDGRVTVPTYTTSMH